MLRFANSLFGRVVIALAERAKSLKSIADFFLNLIPSTVIDAFAKGDILQVLVFAMVDNERKRARYDPSTTRCTRFYAALSQSR